MITVNVIAKSKEVKKKNNYLAIAIYSLFGLFALYFVGTVVVVIFNLISYSQKLSRVKSDSQALSTEILKDNQKLADYILSKYILAEIYKIRNSEFDYKSHLDMILALLPEGNQLVQVDFKTKGAISTTIKSRDINAYRSLEQVLRDPETTKKNPALVSFVSTITSRSADGEISSSLLIAYQKGNGGK